MKRRVDKISDPQDQNMVANARPLMMNIESV
jgi:hypothetical protein